MAFFGSFRHSFEILVVLFAVFIVREEGLALNLRGKDVAQSSIEFNGPPEKVIDGNRQTYCHTARGSVQWWRIDLGAFYCLEKITVVNRQSGYGFRLRGGKVRAGLSPIYSDNLMIGNEVTAAQAADYGTDLQFVANPPVTARYVTVDLEDYLHFAEVMIEEVVNPMNHTHTGVLDLTLVANPALLGSSGDDNSVIAAYKGPNDIATGLSFGRQLTTGGTNADLPQGSVVAVEPPTGCAKGILYRFPETSGIDRTGVFYAEATENSRNTRIQAVILPKSVSAVRIRPLQRTKSASIGDSVTIEMLDVASANANYRWRHNDNAITSWNNLLGATIDNVILTDEGIYSCFIAGRRFLQEHGFMRLIVRACPGGMWGPPSCQNACLPCYNGGICDDKTGACICAPGFSGDNCERFHGRDVFGLNASHSCSGSTDPHSTACRGRLFCLPDPYGCSCAAGYTGLDCMQECPEGKYGADCKQTCHCASGVICLKDTGECNGDCAAQYFGGNCQYPIVQLICQADISTFATPGTTRTSVNWPEPDLTGWDGPTNFTASSDPGDVFQIGTNEIKYKQRFEMFDLDLECSFNVTVVGQCESETTVDGFTWLATEAGSLAESVQRCPLITLNASQPLAVRNCSVVGPPVYFQWEEPQPLTCGEEMTDVNLEEDSEESPIGATAPAATSTAPPESSITVLALCQQLNQLQSQLAATTAEPSTLMTAYEIRQLEYQEQFLQLEREKVVLQRQALETQKKTLESLTAKALLNTTCEQ